MIFIICYLSVAISPMLFLMWQVNGTPLVIEKTAVFNAEQKYIQQVYNTTVVQQVTREITNNITQVQQLNPEYNTECIKIQKPNSNDYDLHCVRRS